MLARTAERHAFAGERRARLARRHPFLEFLWQEISFRGKVLAFLAKEISFRGKVLAFLAKGISFREHALLGTAPPRFPPDHEPQRGSVTRMSLRHRIAREGTALRPGIRNVRCGHAHSPGALAKARHPGAARRGAGSLLPGWPRTRRSGIPGKPVIVKMDADASGGAAPRSRGMRKRARRTGTPAILDGSCSAGTIRQTQG